MRNLCQSRSRIITLLNGENQALMLQSGHWTHGKFLQPTRPAKMTALGSIAERQLLARRWPIQPFPTGLARANLRPVLSHCRSGIAHPVAARVFALRFPCPSGPYPDGKPME